MFQKHSLGEVIFLGLFFLFASLLGTAQVTAAEYPTKPIQLIVPWPAAGITDLTARLFVPYSSEYLGQPMVVLNKPGAGSALGTDFVAKSKPDGYILAFTGATSLGPLKAMNPKIPYDPVKDFTPICLLWTSYYVILVKADAPLNTLEKLVDYARKNPGKLNYGSSGVGSTPHLACELFQQAAGIQMVHIPFKGSAPSLMALLGGHIDLYFADVITPMEQIKAGKLIPLATTTSKRTEDFPDVPSIAEKGYPGSMLLSWGGVQGPAGLPEPIVDKLTKYFQKVLALPDVQKRLKEFGGTAAYLGPAEYGKYIKDNLEMYQDLVRKANIKIE